MRRTYILSVLTAVVEDEKNLDLLEKMVSRSLQEEERLDQLSHE